ncbi:MAG: metallophosphoesterase [Aliiglaciecola sp.]|uniref:metallophosphoesterase n=1 Tax=Aliiglaciecola sp. TaxID=1872441 RepID=UPI0032984962
MKLKHFTITLAAVSVLSACNIGDDNDAEVSALQEQVAQLQTELDNIDTANAAEVATLNATVVAMQTQIDEMTAELASLQDGSNSDTTNEEIAALEAEIASLQSSLDALTATAPILGINATSGANVLPEASDNILRFAIFPDTQGRDDDNMSMYVDVDKDGNTLAVKEYVGVDYNRDGYYDAGTESQNDAVKDGDWDEDGISYLVNVTDPFHPFIELDDAGEPIVVAPEDRKDFGPDWKVIPLPLVEAVTDKMIELDVDLVLATGDITEYRAESDYVQWMEKIAVPLREAGISIFPARGNHEVVNGRNWPAWFTNEQEWERQSVNNVYNEINPYDGYSQVDFDQGYRLYKAYTGSLVQEHIDNGKAIGFPGAEDLVYYFIEDKTMFIALDFYFAELYSSAYKGTWTILRDWLEEVITANASEVDHIVAFGHEPLSTKKRPQTYQVEIYDAYVANRIALEEAKDAAQETLDTAIANNASAEEIAVYTNQLEAAISAYEELEEPSLAGYDIGQLGYLKLQSEAEPGLESAILNLFNNYKVTYIAGHDHQYARSLIHPTADDKDTANGFTQIIGGNASWKAYEDLYGMHDEHETGLFINNFYDSITGGNLTNSEGDNYASISSDLGNGISFVLVEINGRQITTKAYYADHTLTEVDMNLGAHYDYDSNSWCTYSGDFMVAGSVTTTQTCDQVAWQVLDENTRTTDATVRVVAPDQNYYAYSEAKAENGYIGSQATIVDGYNLTYNSSYAATVGEVERLRELFSMSWFVDDDASTLSDVLLLSGNQTQEGSYFNQYGDLVAPDIDVDNGVLAEGESASLTYVNQNGEEVNNPTHTTRDGVFIKGTDIEASLNPSLANGNPSGNDANWDGRYLPDGLDFADALTLVFAAPEGYTLTDLTIGRYDEATQSWAQAFAEECYVETGYSDHYSVYYRLTDQHPEGGYQVSNCQQRYWGYVKDSNTIWGFVHTDGKFAVIEK